MIANTYALYELLHCSRSRFLVKSILSGNSVMSTEVVSPLDKNFLGNPRAKS